MKRATRLAVVSTVLTLSGCHAPPHATAELEARRHWDQVRARVKLQLAEQEYQSGFFERAVRTVSESIALEATRPDAHVLLARAHLELGNAAKAQQVLDAAEQAGVTSPDLIYTQGVVLEQRGQLDAAAAAYAQALALDPTNVDYLVARTECLVELNRPELALELLDARGAPFDDDGTVALLGAHIADLTGDSEGAVRRYRDAIVTFGDSPMVAQELGLLLVRLGRYDEGVALLKPLVEKAMGGEAGGAVRRALASCHLARRNPVAAQRILDEYGRAHPEDVRAQLLLAQAAIGTGDTLTALRALDAAHQRRPDRPEVRLMRAVIQRKRGDFAGAASLLLDLLNDIPEDVEAHCLLAEVLRDRDQVEAARHHFDRALQIDPDCAWAAAGLKSLPDEPRPTPEPSPGKLTSATGS